jgi:hypothetical protein
MTDWCAQFDEWNQTECACIVRYESYGGNANAMTENDDTNRTQDVGLWQINQHHWYDESDTMQTDELQACASSDVIRVDSRASPFARALLACQVVLLR